jgi:ABC-type transport system substrate-binding protein
VQTILDQWRSVASGGFVPAGLPGHVPDIALPFAPDQARDLLAEAGYPGGRGFPTITALTADGEWKRSHARQLALQWRQFLNIELTVEFTCLVDFNTRLGMSRRTSD